MRRRWPATWAPDTACVNWELTIASSEGIPVMREETACPVTDPFPRDRFLETLGLVPVDGGGWHPGKAGSFTCLVVASRKRERTLMKALSRQRNALPVIANARNANSEL